MTFKNHTELVMHYTGMTKAELLERFKERETLYEIYQSDVGVCEVCNRWFDAMEEEVSTCRDDNRELCGKHAEEIDAVQS